MGNKIYSPETCIVVPQRINTLIEKVDGKRGKYPIGVTYDKRKNMFEARLRKVLNGRSKTIHLGHYSTSEEAFYAYKLAKKII